MPNDTTVPNNASGVAPPAIPTPPTAPQGPDMEQFHTLASSGKLTKLIHTLAGTKRK